MPIWAEFSSTPSNKVSLMSDWETKLPAIIEECLQENVTSIAGVPSWMMVLLNKALETTGKENILDIWPNVEVYFHGVLVLTLIVHLIKNYSLKTILNIMKFTMLLKVFCVARFK